MTTMDQIHRIRELYFVQGKNLIEIASIVNCDWRTVRKYMDMEDFNPDSLPPDEQPHTSRLDPFKPMIDCWLAAAYVSLKKKELNLKKQEGYIPLIHAPGEAQADFGYADFYQNGKLHHEAKYLVRSFPYSNGGYLQLNYGENMECLLEGLVAIFEYIGGVPTEIWFDNTRTIVTEIIKGGGRSVTERFQRFCEHYRFRAIFMNPESGWEKGNVENKVGYLRRNELVPVPEFTSITEKNQDLFTVRLRITSSEVTVMDSSLHEIVVHRRLYGDEYERMDWIPYLKYIAHKPRSLKNSGIYSMMPENMQMYVDSCENSERGRVLKVLSELTERSGFHSALNTVDEAIRFHATDPDSLQNLYRRTYAQVPLLPPLDHVSDILFLRSFRSRMIWLILMHTLRKGVHEMADIQETIALYCRQLWLSSNLAERALTLEGVTNQEYLITY